ncbi:dTDP-glucose 4,6-dehydratase [Litorimonas sp. RW-G-Af-16]|uniref:dTDP-glucose 4,6-dehydratase n=1 Tax=Litorimonas sp. RW-G-Af-16 TaxID=3241168 RepID=UPI00390C8993
MTQQSTLLITGGAGFIGSAVLREALSRGCRVVNVDCLTYAALPGTLSDIDSHPDYHFAKVDIRDSDKLRAVFTDHRPDGVIHLAAESHVDRSIASPNDFLSTNIMGTANVLQAAQHAWRESDAEHRFIHVSTDEVFGDLEATDPAFTEDTPYQPSSPYSASKAASDHLVRAWGRTYDMPVILTNCSNNYGPFQYPEKLIPVVIAKALAGEPIPVYGAGENVRDWLFVQDHAKALLDVYTRGVIGESYNIGGNCERRNIDLVKEICRLMDELSPAHKPHRELIKFVTDRPGHDQRYAINSAKIKRDLGWEAETDFSDGLRQTVQWYLDNQNWWKPAMSNSQAQHVA